MNSERILELADIIEAQPDVPSGAPAGFNMKWVHHSCGTPSCIAGWAETLEWSTGNLGQDLGVTLARADDIIMPISREAHFRAEPDRPGYITAAHAAAMLRNLARTGEVDWSVTEYTEAVEELLEENAVVNMACPAEEV